MTSPLPRATCRERCPLLGAKRSRRSRTSTHQAQRRRRGIDARLRKAFASHASDPALARTVSAVQDIYARNVFPAMKVKWATYPNNIGHTFFNGCFRCHDDSHKASDGSVIKQDCETCHAMP